MRRYQREFSLAAAFARPPPELRAMGARGRAWMAHEFDWDTLAAGMVDVYAWLSRGGDPPACVRIG